MPKIITVTFNPALDKSIFIANLVPDKKLKCSQPVYEPGGGGINVARAIKKLGGDAIAIYLSGGEAGKKITSLLNEELIATVPIDINEGTRENLIVADTAHDKQYLFDMPGPVVSEQEWQECLATIKEMPDVAYIIASGSLPAGVPVDIFAKVAVIAREKGAKLIVDTAGEALKLAVEAGVYLIKSNIRELASLVDKETLTISEVADVAKTVVSKGNCEAMVISMGPHGAMLVTNRMILHIKPPVLHIEGTVGAGDSLVAGIILSLSEDKSLTEAVQYGVACGSAATMHPGTELCIKADVETIYTSIRNNARQPKVFFNQGYLQKTGSE